MSKASREIIKHYKKKCARKKSIKFRQVRVNEIEMISLAFYYSRARQQTKKRQLIDHQLSFSFSCAQDKTRTCTNVIVHYPLKVACLPISPPGHCIPEATFGSANIDTILRFAKFLREKRQNLRNACGGAPAWPPERPPPYLSFISLSR